MTDALIEKVARAIYAEWPNCDEAARAALAAIDKSGTHVVVPVSDLTELLAAISKWTQTCIEDAIASGRADLANALTARRDIIDKAIYAARPKVTP